MKSDVKTVKVDEEIKARNFNTLCLNLPMDLQQENLVVSYTKTYKNCDRNGNNKYYYTFFGMDKDYGIIVDLTYNIASVLELKYDFNRGVILDYDCIANYIETGLNRYILNNNLDYKHINVKAVY